MAVTNFFWDGTNVLQEYDATGAPVAHYVTEPFLFGNIIGQFRAPQSTYFHFDALGSTSNVTDNSGTSIGSRRFDAFGTTREHSGSTILSYQYIGRLGYYRDEEHFAYYVRRRHFTPHIGRWNSLDPARYNNNRYLYADNSPLSYVDPSGLTTLPIKEGNQFPPKVDIKGSWVFGIFACIVLCPPDCWPAGTGKGAGICACSWPTFEISITDVAKWAAIIATFQGLLTVCCLGSALVMCRTANNSAAMNAMETCLEKSIATAFSILWGVECNCGPSREHR